MENSKNTGWKHKSTNKLSEKQQAKVGKVMHEFKEGELHSGSKKGPIVKDREQAIAIALSEANALKIKRGAVLTPLDVKDGDIFKTIDGDLIQVSIINSDKDGKYYILRHHPLNNSKPENTLLPFEFDRYYKAGLYEKVDTSSLIKNENKMVRGGYTKPGYDMKTTGVYLFKTVKKGSFNVVSYLFERENDTEDSLEIQDDLRKKLGSILIQNSSWKRLTSGKPVKAKSAYGDYVGTLTRIDDTKNADKYTSVKDNNKYEGGGTIEVGDKVKASKEYGGKSGRVIDKMGSFVVVEYSNGQSDSYHESDLIKKMETGGGLSNRASNETLLNSVIKGESKNIQGIKMSKPMAEAFFNWLKYSPFGIKYKKLSFNKLFKASFSWGLNRYINTSLKDEYNKLKEESAKYIEGGKLNALIEDIKAFDNNIYPKNSDVSYKNRLIIAYFKTKGYSIIEISKALKVVRNS